jgi:3-phosphoshikimate 1-carboxyvinyltransferase
LNVKILPKKVFSSKHEIASISLPPDKSIFHRLLIIGSLTKSRITIPISSIEEIPVDVYATILALQTLGVQIELSRSEIELQGVGIGGYHEPKHQINCANSGTTARLLMGLLAGQNFTSILTGDASLSIRPMKRLADILDGDLGAGIITSLEGGMPVTIKGKELHSGNIILTIASAQMKSAVLLAGLHTNGEVSVTEPLQSRDHSERMLEAFGADIHIKGTTSKITSQNSFTVPEEFTYHVPGDISSAAFMIGAAVMTRRNISLSTVGLNPTRKKFLDILRASGLEFEISKVRTEWGEERGTIEIFGAQSSASKPFVIARNDIPLIIDEIPLLAALASFCNGETIIESAEELRNKESDRIDLLTKNLHAFGVLITERNDGVRIFGDENFIPDGGVIGDSGDHRIAMALSVLALRARGQVTISDASVVSISYPNFFRDLALVAGSKRIRIS